MKTTLLALLLLATSFHTQAQDVESMDAPGETKTKLSEEEKKQKKSDSDVEKISVVGSRIRRLDIEGPAPVHVITREDIEKNLGSVPSAGSSNSQT